MRDFFAECIVYVVVELISHSTGCLSGSDVPPQDAALAIEGLIEAEKKVHIFAIEWFHRHFLGIVLEKLVNAILSGRLSGQEDVLMQLLEMICVNAGDALWPAFKEISGNIATASHCNPTVVTELITQEEMNAIQKSEAAFGTSSTSSERVDKSTRVIFDGMKAVLITLASEIKRCQEPVGFS